MVISMPHPEDMPWNKKRNKKNLIPDQEEIERTMGTLAVSLISARRVKGWWEVKVQCAPMGPFYIGKKDRSYFSALKKSLDEATKRLAMDYKVEGDIDATGGSLYVVLSRTRIAVLDSTSLSKGLYLNRVNVPQEFQGRGIGSALMQRFKQLARQAGHEFIIVEPGGYDPDRQDDRIRWYKRHGFIKNGDHYRLDL